MTTAQIIKLFIDTGLAVATPNEKIETLEEVEQYVKELKQKWQEVITASNKIGGI